MKKAATYGGMLVVLMLVLVLITCDNTGGSGGTLSVGITGCPPGTENCNLYLELYNSGADPLSSSLLAIGSILLGTIESDVMEDPLSDEDIVLDAGDYDLYLWIDINDNIDTMQEPELGTDMSHVSFPFRVTIDSDTKVVITENGFELFPGWDGSGLFGYYIYALLDDTAYEWKLGFTMIENDAFGTVITIMTDATALFATPDVVTGTELPNNYVMIQFAGTTTGTYTMLDSMGSYVINGVQWDFTDITLVVTTFEGIGGVIKGTFSGTVADGSNNTMTVKDGQFNVIHAEYTTP